MKSILSLFALLAVHYYTTAQKNFSLTATYQKDKKVVLLQWQHLHKNAISYTLQSSKDNTFFSDIFTKLNTENFIGSTIKYIDKTATGEKIYYRLKINLNDSISETSLPIMAPLNITLNTWLLYPLPVQDFVHLKYTGNGIIDGVIAIYIQRISSGTIFTRLRFASNTTDIIIPTTNLGRGMYNIHVSIGNRTAWNQQFIKL
jgi:hypothetical protein